MSKQIEKPRLLNRIAIATGVILTACLAFNLIEYGSLKTFETAHSLWSRRNIIYSVAYLSTYFLSVAAIVVALFSRSAIVRWLALGTVFFFLGAEFCSRLLVGANIGFSEVHTALSEITFVDEFLNSYTTSMIKAALIAAVISAVVYAVVRLSKLRFTLRWLMLIPVAALLSYGVIWRTGAMTDRYPSPLRVPVLMMYATLNSLDTGPRDPVALIIPDDAPQPRVVLFIMDESIRGDYLSINGWSMQTTPWLESAAGEFLNFGITCSASNISSSSNLILRAGLRADQLPDRNQIGLRQSSIFQYAKTAGYRTCYLDGQYPPGVLENYMKKHDLDSIDETYWAIEDEPDPDRKHQRDRLLAQRILELVDEDEPTFIWVNKYGAHIHYDRTYPQSQRIFTPTMPPSTPIDACSLKQIDNSYSNAVRWAADGFLELLLPELDLTETVVIYTSDHGQSFKEGGATHADREDPPVSQANVPLLSWGQLMDERFPDGVESVHDQTSHYQIFPTLLIIMGYAQPEVSSRYGEPLWGSPPQRRIFLSGDAFGRGITHLNEFDTTPAPSAPPHDK